MNDRQLQANVAPVLAGALLSTAAALAIASSPAQAVEVRRDGEAVSQSAQAGCEHMAAKACVEQALLAMGGREKLAGIRNVRYRTIGHTIVTEQSYRQQPFFTAYQRDTLTVDFVNGRILDAGHLTWPESDPGQFENDQTLVATPTAGVYRGAHGDTPCGLSDLDAADDAIALGPERLLLTASQAADLHYVEPRWLRDTPHAAVAFTWRGMPTIVLLNAANHLPDAMLRTRTFQDFWFAWGDVQQLVYFDNWHLVDGIVMPTNRIEARNGIAWQSTQATDIAFNVAIDDKQFAMDAAVAAKAAQSPGWERPFKDPVPTTLAPGVLLYQGSWNTTLIRQDDGVLVLEAPISGTYAHGVIAKARGEFPGLPVKGVLSTSDSWPHVAGVREAVAQGLPVYALDLDLRELNAMLQAPHTLHPDALQRTPAPPQWNAVTGRLEVGHGDNRVVIYPLPGPSTERQYMVWFPQYRLLYASDTLALNADQSLYDPQLMHEVMQAVERNGLVVETVFAMHEGPRPWKDVVKLVRAALGQLPAVEGMPIAGVGPGHSFSVDPTTRQEIEMNAFMKLTAAALGAASIAGGVAVAQDTSSKDPYANPDTANYGTPPGAPLKRDGSLRADPKAPVVTDSAATDSSSTTTTTTSSTTWNNPPAAAPAPAAPVADTSTTTTDTAPAVDTTPAPRPDRN